MAQVKVPLVACAILESVWVYAVIAVVGLILGIGGSPMPWHVMLLVSGLSFLNARGLALIIMPPMLPYIIQMAIGVIVIYSVVGILVQSEGHGFSLDWIRAFRSDAVEPGYHRVVLLTGILSIVMWWRGGRLASVEYPLEHLGTNFRIGLIILSVAAVADIISRHNLRIFPLMFVYFATGLVGLSFGHLLPASRQTADARSWPKVIVSTIAAVLSLGLLFSLLQKSVLDFIAAPFVVVLNVLAKIFFFVFLVPIVYVIDFLIRGIFNIFSRFKDDGEPMQLEIGNFSEMFQEIQEDTGDTGPSMLFQFLEWTAIAIVISIVLYFLARSFRRNIRWRRIDQPGLRESVVDDPDALTDLRKLLLNLLPDRFRRKGFQPSYRLPDDDAEIIEAFKLYFGVLTRAENQGYARQPSQTPYEYRTTLSRILPYGLVKRITQIFSEACYGHRSPCRTQIDEIRQEIERINASN